MNGLLNYQPSNSAVYYVPPKRVNWVRMAVGFVVAAALAALGAVLYVVVLPKVGSIYLRLGTVAAAAVATGLLGVIPVRMGRVRSPVVAAFMGAVLAIG